MRTAFIVFAAVAALFGLMAYNEASTKETTPLDEALTRPINVHKFVDEEAGVVCYFIGRVPRYITCVPVEKK